MYMKRIFGLVLALMLVAVVPAFAANLGYTLNSSSFDLDTSHVNTHTDSFFAGGVLGSGSATGSELAGGQALTTHTGTFTNPGDVGRGTQNFGEAIGGFGYIIQTGSKNFCWIIPPMAGAIAGTDGAVSQHSFDMTNMSGGNGLSGSSAGQRSGAGFIGADADLLIGKNRGPVTGAFTGDSVVNGYSYSESYKGTSGETKYIGTQSGAGNNAETIITGDIGSGYAYGSGETSGGSSVYSTTPGIGSTSGMYTGQFSYRGNGQGDVAGYSQSYGTTLPHGAIFGSSSGISVNVSK